MLKKVRNASRWISAMRQFEAGNNVEFLDRVKDFDVGFQFSYYQRCIIATSLLIVGNYIESQEKFKEIVSDIGESDNPNEKYLRYYCLARLDGIEGNMGSVNNAASRAALLDCKSLYRLRLPII